MPLNIQLIYIYPLILIHTNDFFIYLSHPFADAQRERGAVLLHTLGAIYFFTLLAVVVNDYFLPSVEIICEDLNIPKVCVRL